MTTLERPPRVSLSPKARSVFFFAASAQPSSCDGTRFQRSQRELFDTAGSVGDVLKSAARRAQIARFLHRHKDDEESPADCVSSPNMTKRTLHDT